MSGKPSFYITTPIYYVNDIPHIGHAYTTLACDYLARFKRLDGFDVMFLTGTDEHGQKVEKSAAAAGKTPIEFCDQVSQRFRELAEFMNYSNDDFIRTTEERHKIACQDLWKKLEDKSWATSIAILGGAGRIGSKLVDDLCQSFQTVIAIDPRYTEDQQELKGGSTVIYTKRKEALRDTRLVLVLTAKGEDIIPIVDYFEPGTVIADDTHPCIKRKTRERLNKRGVDLWKTVVTSSNYGMYPRMPNFRNDNIPGCLLEALVLNATGDEVLESTSKFFEETKNCGYKTLLIRHPNDS
mgnify:CR=1 FL=1